MKAAAKISLWIFGALVIAALLSGTVAWDGSVYTTIRLELRDDETDRPIEGAFIFAGQQALESFQAIRPEVKEAYLSAAPYVGRTNQQGLAQVSFSSRAGGGTIFFWRTGSYHIEEDLIIQSDSYDEIHVLAQNLLGQKTFPIRKREHSTSIYMKKKKTEPNKAVEPTPVAVTPDAKASAAPPTSAAHL